PEVVASPRTPSPDVHAAKEPSEITVMRTPPPELVAATRTPMPEVAAVRTPPPRASDDYSSPIAAAAAAAASEADRVTPPPEPRASDELAASPIGSGVEPGMDGAALPSLEMQANAGLATLPAVALSDAESG